MFTGPGPGQHTRPASYLHHPPSLSITPIFFPKNLDLSEDQLEPVDLSLKREVATVTTSETLLKATGLAAVLEKLPLVGKGCGEGVEQYRKEHRCDYSDCLKVTSMLEL